MVSSAQTPRLFRSPATATATATATNFNVYMPHHSSPSHRHPSPPSDIFTTRKSLLSRQTSSVDLAKSFLHRLHRTEPQVNSFLYISPEEVLLRQAKELDDKIKNNDEVSKTFTSHLGGG